MSGILNGDSIYKSGGGGGGGYKNGGILIDAQFIKLENNSVYDYKNTSRNEVNFYFDYKEDEILNSIVQIHTNVNATVNVLKKEGDEYYPLGNFGSDSITANKDYTLNIVGDFFNISEVTTPSNNYPEYIDFIGGYYGIKIIDCGIYLVTADMGWTTKSGALATESSNTGWHLINSTVIQYLKDQYTVSGLRSNSGWNNEPQGTNVSQLNFKPDGRWNGNMFLDVGNASWFIKRDSNDDVSDNLRQYVLNNDNTSGQTGMSNVDKVKLRLYKTKS